MHRFAVVVILFLFSFSSFAMAQKKEVTGYFGLLHASGGTEMLFGGSIALIAENNLGFEADFSYVHTDIGGIKFFNGNLVYNVELEGGKVIPYIAGGAGIVLWPGYKYTNIEYGWGEEESSFEKSTYTRFTINFGGGIKIKATNDIAFRIDFREIGLFFGDVSFGDDPFFGEELTFSVGTHFVQRFCGGITYAFGGKTRKAKPKPAIEEEFGFINIYSIPENVFIYHKGELLGTTPLTNLRLKPGTYNLMFEKEGYLSVIKSVTIFSNQAQKLQVELIKE